MPRTWAQIQDGRAHWIFDADAPPVCHASVLFLDITGQHVTSGAIFHAEDGSFVPAQDPPIWSPSLRVVSPILPLAQLEAVSARVVSALTTEAMGYFGNVWVRVHHFAKAGEVHQGHRHTFDHVSFLMKGRARVTVNGRATDYAAINFLTMAKGDEHEIVALEDGTEWWCVFAVRDAQGDVSEIVNESQHDPSYFAT